MKEIKKVLDQTVEFYYKDFPGDLNENISENLNILNQRYTNSIMAEIKARINHILLQAKDSTFRINIIIEKTEGYYE